jgi:hypothetical protein
LAVDAPPTARRKIKVARARCTLLIFFHVARRNGGRRTAAGGRRRRRGRAAEQRASASPFPRPPSGRGAPPNAPRPRARRQMTAAMGSWRRLRALSRRERGRGARGEGGGGGRALPCCLSCSLRTEARGALSRRPSRAPRRVREGCAPRMATCVVQAGRDRRTAPCARADKIFKSVFGLPAVGLHFFFSPLPEIPHPAATRLSPPCEGSSNRRFILPSSCGGEMGRMERGCASPLPPSV